MTKKKPTGRPTLFTDEIAREITDRVSKGQSLRFICDDDHIPTRETVRTWLRDKPEFSAQYARAHEEYADEVFEEMLEIADDGRNDFVEKHTQRGTFVALDDEAVSRSRLRVDTRKWILARLAPKKYGDKIEVDATIKGDVHVVIGGNA